MFRQAGKFLLALLAIWPAAAAAQGGAAPGSPWQPANLDRAAFLQAAARHGVLLASRFGARPGDGRDDSRAVAAALIEARRRGAAAVLLPAGHYLFAQEVRLLSGVALVGEGCGRTIIERSPAHRGQILFRVDGVSRVRVQGVSFEYRGAPQYFRAVGLRGAGSSEVAVIGNCFDDARPGSDGGDRSAIDISAETSPSERIWISGNRVAGRMQLTSGGGAGVSVLRIIDNEVRDARNSAIAVTHLPRGAMFRDLLIAGNRIYDTQSLGIYIGPDHYTGPGGLEGRGGTFENVAIRDNAIRGFTGRYPHGIYIRAAERRSNGFTIAGNRLDGSGSRDHVGIRLVDKHGRGARRITDVVVRDNQVSGFEWGIWLSSTDGAEVRGNQVGGGRPYRIAREENYNLSSDAPGPR